MHRLYAELLFNQGYVADPALARALDGQVGDGAGDPVAADAAGAVPSPPPATAGRRPGRLRATLALLLPGQGR